MKIATSPFTSFRYTQGSQKSFDRHVYYYTIGR